MKIIQQTIDPIDVDTAIISANNVTIDLGEHSIYTHEILCAEAYSFGGNSVQSCWHYDSLNDQNLLVSLLGKLTGKQLYTRRLGRSIFVFPGLQKMEQFRVHIKELYETK